MLDESVATTPETTQQTTPESAPSTEPAQTAPTTEAAVSTESPPAQTAEAAPPPAEEPAVGNRYEKSLEALMSKARDTRRQQVEQQQQQAQLDFARRVAEAQQYGPEAVKRLLGIEEKKLDLTELLGGEDDGEPPTVKELKKKVTELEGFIKQEQKSAAERQEAAKREQMSAWERSEVGKIEQFLDANKDKYEFTSQLKEIGSQRDIYNGIINMYQAGYTPSYEDMAGLVESRIEDILDRLAQSPKFKTWASKKLQTSQSQTASAQSAPTLTGALNADSVASIPPDNESDEQNRQRALKAAMAAREAALKKLKEVTKG